TRPRGAVADDDVAAAVARDGVGVRAAGGVLDVEDAAGSRSLALDEVDGDAGGVAKIADGIVRAGPTVHGAALEVGLTIESEQVVAGVAVQVGRTRCRIDGEPVVAAIGVNICVGIGGRAGDVEEVRGRVRAAQTELHHAVAGSVVNGRGVGSPGEPQDR